MPTRIETHKEEILAAIETGYGIQLNDLQFLLRGWGGDCFAGRGANGKRYFLKFHDSVEPSALAASERDFYLPLMHQLHHQQILPDIPTPLATRSSALFLPVADYEVVISAFIPGDLVGFGPLPDEVFSRLATLVGQLHASLPQLSFEHPFYETFKTGYEALLAQVLKRLQNVTPSAPPGQQALRRALQPRLVELECHQERHSELQRYARSQSKTMVVCHTDLHGANLMMAGNRLYILDWENAMIAPPEHDLFFFINDERFWDHFYPPYRQQAGPIELDAAIFEFYFMRRAFEDITDFVLRILAGDGDPQRDLEDLVEILDYLASLAKLPAKMFELQDQLKAYLG
ncbi:MAG: aminoglycoside phosphotransferase family protein [Anaerolineales bacterium]|nr:aminoglycoside phosphotransferase family protein [Anaerolineales bacterium]